jgi:hypothetical protein
LREYKKGSASLPYPHLFKVRTLATYIMPAEENQQLGEIEYFQPTVRNRLSTTIILANFVIKYGKFYDISEYLHRFCFTRSIDKYISLENRFKETASAQGTNITSKEEHAWGHTRRENTPTGTEGTFEVRQDGELIAEIYWDCPYIGPNKIEKRNVKSGYDVSFDNFSFPSGSLGEGIINIRED